MQRASCSQQCSLIAVACEDVGVDRAFGLGLETSNAFETTNSKTVSDLIEAETGVAFETAVNDQTLGKYGDLVVVSCAIYLGVVDVYLNGAPCFTRARADCWLDVAYHRGL